MLVMELVVSRAERLTELNADLTRSNDELDAFAYVASHDLKEPLRGIHKYAHQLLESAKFLDTENHKRVQNLMRLTVRMDSLLDSLLHFSRVGRSALELETADLNEVIQEALEMIGARRSDCALQVTLPRPFPHWRCDRIRIREVYTNLLSNSIKYSGTKAPQVELGFLRPDEFGLRPNAPASSSKQTVFYVSDNGIGIEPRHFEHVFRIFKRLHGRDEFGGGVGAGLTIVQKHVQRHGGCVWVDSKPGVGSTFFFTMPCGEEDASC
jgi:light-regulated signal transduction histidine kinase (bacteriophytochrome)